MVWHGGHRLLVCLLCVLMNDDNNTTDAASATHESVNGIETLLGDGVESGRATHRFNRIIEMPTAKWKLFKLCETYAQSS